MIKARVTYKSEKREWHNSKSEGRLFHVHLLDETGEIKATGFNEQVDQFFDVLQEGKVYFVSKCRVNMAKKQFNQVNNDYELTMGNDTEITEVFFSPLLPPSPLTGPLG
jgi:replication factor A1